MWHHLWRTARSCLARLDLSHVGGPPFVPGQGWGISDDAIRAIVDNCAHLKTLHLGGNSRLTEACIPLVRELSARGCYVAGIIMAWPTRLGRGLMAVQYSSPSQLPHYLQLFEAPLRETAHNDRPRVGCAVCLRRAAAAVYQIPNTEHMAYRLVRTLVYKRGVGIRETVLVIKCGRWS